MSNHLKPFWQNRFQFNARFGLFLLLIICVPRFLLVLNANQTGNYGPIGAIMVVSALVPFLFLHKAGRRSIGIRGTRKWGALLLAFGLGILLALVLYAIGVGLYGDTIQNWYVYIGKSYAIPDPISPADKRILFAVMAITGMLFSPVGEELFFRGIVHGSFATSVGERRASLIDSTAFALTHLAHFGLVYTNGTWAFFLLPALLWVAGMFGVSLVFFRMKQWSGSLWGAICCHAGFNLAMIWCIFYVPLRYLGH
jgi:uncharacterized protein